MCNLGNTVRSKVNISHLYSQAEEQGDSEFRKGFVDNLAGQYKEGRDVRCHGSQNVDTFPVPEVIYPSLPRGARKEISGILIEMFAFPLAPGEVPED